MLPAHRRANRGHPLAGRLWRVYLKPSKPTTGASLIFQISRIISGHAKAKTSAVQCNNLVNRESGLLQLDIKSENGIMSAHISMAHIKSRRSGGVLPASLTAPIPASL